MKILIAQTKYLDSLLLAIRSEATDCWHGESRVVEHTDEDGTSFEVRFQVSRGRDELLKISDVSARCTSDSHNWCFKKMYKEVKSSTFLD